MSKSILFVEESATGQIEYVQKLPDGLIVTDGEFDPNKHIITDGTEEFIYALLMHWWPIYNPFLFTYENTPTSV